MTAEERDTAHAESLIPRATPREAAQIDYINRRIRGDATLGAPFTGEPADADDARMLGNRRRELVRTIERRIAV